ncbi:MAG: TIGR00266 family protein [Coriobacteriales bacterium]|nr:TIGR00266 family protein [Coriobacteriales bacterium]
MLKYKIIGETFPVVEFKMKRGQEICVNNGGMHWMDNCFEMKTQAGGVKGFFKKAVSGTDSFRNYYTALDDGKFVAGMDFPGTVLPVILNKDESIVLAKQSFMASDVSVEFDIHVQKKIKSGIFSGQGFILQKLTATKNESLAFVQVAGSIVKKTLKPGKALVVQSGGLVGYTQGINMSVQSVKGMKNKLLGGQGFFNTILEGDGEVWVQTFNIDSFVKWTAAETGGTAGAITGAAIGSAIANSN